SSGDADDVRSRSSDDARIPHHDAASTGGEGHENHAPPSARSDEARTLDQRPASPGIPGRSGSTGPGQKDCREEMSGNGLIGTGSERIKEVSHARAFLGVRVGGAGV